MNAQQPVPIEIFSSYAEADDPLSLELDKHLSLLKHEGLISAFHRRRLTAGTDRVNALDSRLNTASLILLLVSSDFLASDQCYGVELKRAMERHEAGDARVIPILLRPCDWQTSPIGSFQVLPSNGRPVTNWRNRDHALADVTQGIRGALQNLEHLAVNSPSTKFPHIWNIPYPRNPVFTGRQDILSRIHMQLQAGQATALSQPQALCNSLMPLFLIIL